MKTTFIYALCEPGTRTVRYIGKTGNLKRRFSQHIGSKARTHLGCWIRSIVVLGLTPSLEVFREVPEEKGSEAEMRYIRLAKGCGMRLVNSTDGGEGCQNPPPEIRAKIRAALLGEKNYMFGKVTPPETRAKISAALLGRTRTSKTRAKMSVAQKGHACSDEARAKMSAARTGRTNTPEARAKISAALLGKSRPPETRAKISAAQLGEKNHNFGNVASPETCAKMRAAQQLRRAKEKTRK